MALQEFSPKRPKYILVATDCFTKFSEVVLIYNNVPTFFVDAMVYGVFTKYCSPMHLHCEDTQFFAQLFQEVCKLLCIKETSTTPFCPQSDGQSKRNIKTITETLSMATMEQSEWDLYLPSITMATTQESTGRTPIFSFADLSVSKAHHIT